MERSQARLIAAARQPNAWKLSSAARTVDHGARAEAAVIDYLLAERQRAELVALRTPAANIVKELGERPTTSASARPGTARRRGSRAIGRERHQGQRQRARALTLSWSERAQGEAQQRRLRKSQGRLGREQTQSREAQRGMGTAL